MSRQEASESLAPNLPTEPDPTTSDSVATETRLRSFLKAVSWRLVATLTTVGITWWVTGKIKTALEVGSGEFVLKFLIYYAHERAWALVPHWMFRKP